MNVHQVISYMILLNDLVKKMKLKIKGIVLAGGKGNRLYPMTQACCKQLLPIYDKPMIYYPISVLMMAGIKDILMITTENDLPLFKKLLSDGSHLGISISYTIQKNPNGLAEAFILGKEFIGNNPSALILGDNIFYGSGLTGLLQQFGDTLNGCHLFGYRVKDPERYGVAEIDDNNSIISLEEKPKNPKSNIAITGLYFYDNQVTEIVKSIKPSARGELEITDLNKVYVNNKQANLILMQRGMAWLDTGTPESLLQASQFVETLQNRQGNYISCLEEIAFRMKFINSEQLEKLISSYGNNDYSNYLKSILS